MSVDERTRRDMYTGLEDALGAPVADAVMAHLPPTGWADVARTHDVAVLRGEMVAMGDALRSEMGPLGDGLRREMISMEERIGLRIDARVASETNRLLLFLVPTMTTIVGLAFAAAKLS